MSALQFILRGLKYFRSSYLGVVADDPNYAFPIYHDLVEIKGPDSWRPEAEIVDARLKEKK